MNWKQLLSNKRFGLENLHEARKEDRTEFQRDYDRLIFSAPFRRLQNKTQGVCKTRHKSFPCREVSSYTTD